MNKPFNIFDVVIGFLLGITFVIMGVGFGFITFNYSQQPATVTIAIPAGQCGFYGPDGKCEALKGSSTVELQGDSFQNSGEAGPTQVATTTCNFPLYEPFDLSYLSGCAAEMKAAVHSSTLLVATTSFFDKTATLPQHEEWQGVYLKCPDGSLHWFESDSTDGIVQYYEWGCYEVDPYTGKKFTY